MPFEIDISTVSERDTLRKQNQRKQREKPMTFILLIQEIPNNHLGCFISNPVNNGIKTYQPQLVSLPDF